MLMLIASTGMFGMLWKDVGMLCTDRGDLESEANSLGMLICCWINIRIMCCFLLSHQKIRKIFSLQI